jgi:hypothetical protein
MVRGVNEVVPANVNPDMGNLVKPGSVKRPGLITVLRGVAVAAVAAPAEVESMGGNDTRRSAELENGLR